MDTIKRLNQVLPVSDQHVRHAEFASLIGQTLLIHAVNLPADGEGLTSSVVVSSSPESPRMTVNLISDQPRKIARTLAKLAEFPIQVMFVKEAKTYLIVDPVDYKPAE